MVYLYTPVGSGMFIEDILQNKVLDHFKIVPQASEYLLEFNKNQAINSKLNRVYVIMTTSMKYQIFTEIKWSKVK